MAWRCKKCNNPEYKVTPQSGQICCVQCNHCTKPTSLNEHVTVSPVPRQFLELSSDDEGDDGIERQSSYDKPKKKLRGAAKKSKVSRIMKEREQVGDSDDLIDTNELKSSAEGLYIHDRVLRCKKARVLKKKIQQAVLDLNRSCGYGVHIEIQAPLPDTGPRAAGFVLDLKDKNGEKVVGSKKNVEKSSSDKSVVKVNRGIMFLSRVEGNYVKKLTPTKQRQSESRRNSGTNMFSPTNSDISLVTNIGDENPCDDTSSDSPTLLDNLDSPSSSLATFGSEPFSQQSPKPTLPVPLKPVFKPPKIPYSATFPLKINGLGSSRQKLDIHNLDLNKQSEAFCGICLQEKKSASDKAFRYVF